MPALSGRGIGAVVVAAIVVAAAGWGVGNASSSGGETGARDALPESFTPSRDRVEIGTLTRRRDLPKLGSSPAKASTPKKTSKAPSRPVPVPARPVPAPPPPPPPVATRPPVVVPPPPPQSTPGGDFSTTGET